MKQASILKSYDLTEEGNMSITIFERTFKTMVSNIKLWYHIHRSKME